MAYKSKAQKAREEFYETLTPTQSRIIELLSDGMPHRRVEILKKCLNDEMATRIALGQHIYFLRKKLRPMGQDIICQLSSRVIYYRHVILLANPYNGSR